MKKYKGYRWTCEINTGFGYDATFFYGGKSKSFNGWNREIAIALMKSYIDELKSMCKED